MFSACVHPAKARGFVCVLVPGTATVSPIRRKRNWGGEH
jgi:hypothetical protein